IDAAVDKVQGVHFAVGILPPRHDPYPALGQLLVLGHLLGLLVVTEHPHAAGVVVAVDVGSVQLGVLLAVVDEAACEGTELGGIVLDNGLEDWRRPFLAFGPERVASLADAPAVVTALLDEVHRLPQILPDFAGPQIAGCGIEADLPRLANAVAPDLAAGMRCL